MGGSCGTLLEAGRLNVCTVFTYIYILLFYCSCSFFIDDIYILLYTGLGLLSTDRH